MPTLTMIDGIPVSWSERQSLTRIGDSPEKDEHTDTTSTGSATDDNRKKQPVLNVTSIVFPSPQNN